MRSYISARFKNVLHFLDWHFFRLEVEEREEAQTSYANIILITIWEYYSENKLKLYSTKRGILKIGCVTIQHRIGILKLLALQ